MTARSHDGHRRWRTTAGRAEARPDAARQPTTGGSTYLLFDGRRAVVNLDDAAVARGMGMVGQAPLPVSSTLLNLIPEMPPIASPRIPDVGKRGPGSLSGFAVGSVLRVARSGGDEYYVVLREGVQRVGQLAAELVRFADSLGTRTAISVAPDVIRTTKPVTRLPVSDFPDRALLQSAALARRSAPGGRVRRRERYGHVFGWRPAYSAGRAPVTLAQADAEGPAVDAVYCRRGAWLMCERPACRVAMLARVPGIWSPTPVCGSPFTTTMPPRTSALPATMIPAPWPSTGCTARGTGFEQVQCVSRAGHSGHCSTGWPAVVGCAMRRRPAPPPTRRRRLQRRRMLRAARGDPAARCLRCDDGRRSSGPRAGGGGGRGVGAHRGKEVDACRRRLVDPIRRADGARLP